jgi:hypothetical protein
MNRRTYIELIRRQIYGSQPSDDAEITVGLVNKWLDISIAAAAQQNYKGNIALEGISYVNNGFYTTFKNIAVTKDENFLWKVALPQIPVGIGENDGVPILVFKDAANNQLSQNVVWLTQNQRSFNSGRRQIPNKLLAYQEADAIYVISTIILSQYTASVTMISGGTSTDLTSTINVPPDYFTVIVDYMKTQLMFQRQMPQDVQNDGLDAIKTT